LKRRNEKEKKDQPMLRKRTTHIPRHTSKTGPHHRTTNTATTSART